MSDAHDSVTELDAWLQEQPGAAWQPMSRETAQRARDEIVALRLRLREQEVDVSLRKMRVARAEALEEAAAFAEHHGENWIAENIRALKAPAP